MRRLFVDASFYIAFTHGGDQYHQSAALLANEFQQSPVEFVTNPAVLIEVLAYFSRRGPELRERASALIQELLASPAVEVAQLDTELLESAVALYRARPDKRYSLADCISMEYCRRRSITDVLTSDRDFEAEGFTILLKVS